MTPEDDPSYPEKLTRLGEYLSRRFNRSYDLKDFQPAFDTLQKARGLIPEGHPLLVPILAGLGTCYSSRFQRFGELQDLKDCMEKFQAVVSLLPEQNPDLPEYLKKLSQSIMHRYKRFGKLEDLEWAIVNFQRAITLAGSDNHILAYLIPEMAISLELRYDRLGDLEDLNLAVKGFKTGINHISDNHPAKINYLIGLGEAYIMKYTRLGDIHDIDSSIQYLRAVLKLLPQSHPAISHVLITMADLKKYKRLRNLNDLKTALNNAQAAVEKIPEGHPFHVYCIQVWAEVLAAQYRSSGNPDHLKAAFENYYASCQVPSFDLAYSWSVTSDWASLAQEHSSEELLKAYKSMFDLLPATFWIGNSLSARQQEVTRFHIAQTTSDAIAACVEHGNLALAIEFLDQGLATSFQHMLQLRPDLDSLPEADATKLQDISTQLYTGKSPSSHQLAIERNKLLAEIRKRSDFEHFLLPRPYSVLCKASGNGPIIILNSHKSHCDGIILLNPASEPLHVQLPDVTLVELEHQKNILKGLLSRCNVRSRDSDSTRLFAGFEGSRSKPVHESFQEMLTWLWKNVVGPIYKALENSNIVDGRVWWCPIGAFTGLPLHAAAPSDQFISSYIATITALLDAQALPESEAPKLGVVGVTHSGKGQQAALPGVKKEIKVVSDLAGGHLSQSLVGERATVEAVTSQLQNCEWVHLACHGKQDLRDPPKSCLQLYGGTLELETIMQMPLSKAEFVFLAACQTAMGDAQMVNESFHLGGGFIAAGFRSSIGTLWSMRDSDGPGVAETVYTYLFRKDTTPKVTDAAKALQLALRKLRDAGVPYQHWVPFIHMGI
ncbi:CHAT domain-containing protein [Mycena vulgaris]|nr:CHAT domain-containing protein [Mycena vulgaris]